jgi:hypothetical protein
MTILTAIPAEEERKTFVAANFRRKTGEAGKPNLCYRTPHRWAHWCPGKTGYQSPKLF